MAHEGKWLGGETFESFDKREVVLTCMRYIELNPVRAGMVGHPSEHPWSSYRHTALGEADELLSMHDEYRRRGKTDEDRQAAYRQLFRGRIAQSTLEGKYARPPTKPGC